MHLMAIFKIVFFDFPRGLNRQFIEETEESVEPSLALEIKIAFLFPCLAASEKAGCMHRYQQANSRNRWLRQTNILTHG